MIVVDTNVIAYLFLKGEYNQNAEKLLKSDSDWSVPILWRSELRSILTLYLRKNLIISKILLLFKIYIYEKIII